MFQILQPVQAILSHHLFKLTFCLDSCYQMDKSLILSCFQFACLLVMHLLFSTMPVALSAQERYCHSLVQTTHILLPRKMYPQEGIVRFLWIAAVVAAFDWKKLLHDAKTGKTSNLCDMMFQYLWSRQRYTNGSQWHYQVIKLYHHMTLVIRSPVSEWLYLQKPPSTKKNWFMLMAASILKL